MATTSIRLEGAERKVVDSACRRPRSAELGFAVFTTLATQLIRTRQALFRLDYHFERLFASAKALGIMRAIPAHDSALLWELVVEHAGRTAAANGERSRLRITLDENGAEITLESFKPMWPSERALALWTVPMSRPLAEHKTTSAAVSVLARREAERKGADEALLVDGDGTAREGAWSNLFWIDRSGGLVTPASGVLPGVTRRVVLELAACSQRDARIEELLDGAQEVFLTQSTTGISAVGSINGIAIGEGSVGPRTSELQERYANELHARALFLE